MKKYVPLYPLLLKIILGLVVIFLVILATLSLISTVSEGQKFLYQRTQPQEPWNSVEPSSSENQINLGRSLNKEDYFENYVDVNETEQQEPRPLVEESFSWLKVSFFSRAYSGLSSILGGHDVILREKEFHPYDIILELKNEAFAETEFSHIHYLEMAVGQNQQPMNFFLDLNKKYTHIPINTRECDYLIEKYYTKQTGNQFFTDCSLTRKQWHLLTYILYDFSDYKVYGRKEYEYYYTITSSVSNLLNYTSQNTANWTFAPDFNATVSISQSVSQQPAIANFTQDKLGFFYGDRVFQVVTNFLEVQDEINFNPRYFKESLTVYSNDSSYFEQIENDIRDAEEFMQNVCENCSANLQLEGTKHQGLENRTFGLLGLSPELTYYSRTNFIQRLTNYTMIYYSMFGFRFVEDKFYLTLGGYDVNHAREYGMVWINSEPDVWMVSMWHTMHLKFVDKYETEVDLDYRDEVIFDFNSPVIELSYWDYDALYLELIEIPHCGLNSSTSLVTCECNSLTEIMLPTIEFTLGQFVDDYDQDYDDEGDYEGEWIKFTLKPEHFVRKSDGLCEVMIKEGKSQSYDHDIVLGQPFFKAFSPVFDLDRRRIGFMSNVEKSPRLSTKKKRVIYAFGSIVMIIIWAVIFKLVLKFTERLVKDAENYKRQKREYERKQLIEEIKLNKRKEEERDQFVLQPLEEAKASRSQKKQNLQLSVEAQQSEHNDENDLDSVDKEYRDEEQEDEAPIEIKPIYLGETKTQQMPGDGEIQEEQKQEEIMSGPEEIVIEDKFEEIDLEEDPQDIQANKEFQEQAENE